MQSKPPKLAQRFLLCFLREELSEEVLGDLEEKFFIKLEESSAFRARLNYWYQVLHYLRPFAIRNFTSISHYPNHYAMYQSYFKIGWRNLIKHKGYSFISIGGLSVGMVVSLLIGFWMHDELTFNQYHDNHERIAWVMQNQTFDGGEIQTWQSQALQLAPELRDNYGEYFDYVSMANFSNAHTLFHEQTVLTKNGIFMEPVAPEMLTLDMLSGTRGGLSDPNSILLSESTAKAFFGDEDAMNKIIRINDWYDVKVTGVYKDLPHNSSFANIEFIAPWALYEQGLPEWISWGNNWFQTIVQIADHTSMAQVSTIIKDTKLERIGEDEGKRFNPQLFLHPMDKMHLYREFKQGVNVGGRIQYVWLFGITGFFVLLLACINFMNLSTARSEKRSKEIGVRKAVGSLRNQLIKQFFVESILVAILAFIIALLGAQIFLPFFNDVADKEIRILWTNPFFWLSGISFALLTGILSGSYPAIYLSSIRAVSVLKGTFKLNKMTIIPRKVLIVLQFTVSVALIIGTIIIFQQIQYVKNRPVGYAQNKILTVPLKSSELNQHFNTFRNELLNTGKIEEVAKSEASITDTYVTNSGMDWTGKDPAMQDEFVTLRISHEFGETIGWNLIEGRDFSRELASDSMAFVINEAAAEYMGLADPIGEKVKWGNNGIYTIIGVVENMITQSPYTPVKQMIFFIDYNRSSIANIKISSNSSTHEALADIEAIYKKHDPLNPFEYSFLDQEYAKKFGNEERVGKLAGLFTLLAILISCLGLFGLSAYMAEQRTKEIGIRKVMGASISQLWKLLSRDFVVLVSLSILFAAPLAYFFMLDWLQKYEYRTDIHWWVFAIAGLGALLITLLTVSYQTIKAALMNPVKSLRSE